jgi:hypothetical protein
VRFIGRDHGGMYLSTSSSFSLDDVLLLVSSSAVACVLKRHDGILLEVSVEEGKIANAEEHCRDMLCIEEELIVDITRLDVHVHIESANIAICNNRGG